MAGNPLYTELLIGLGLREFSVAPGEMLGVKDAIRRVKVGPARELARQCLELGSAVEIEALLLEGLAGRPPGALPAALTDPGTAVSPRPG
jgi:phosphoenolpyruvate-protein kinase (PTS system EI component)